MTTPKFGESPLWAHYTETRLTGEPDLADFKSSGVNYKLALWDPAANGLRYLKSLIFHIGQNLSAANRARLSRIPHRDLGNPIAVRCHGELMCLDYLLGVHEVEFISAHVPLEGARVLEIGAGYGRTCHTVLSNHQVAEYWIVDLPNALALSRAYLSEVLPADQRARVHFVPVDEAEALFAVSEFDLCLNIDSFAEMSEDTVRDYLSAIDATCRWFYVNNPVGKYADTTAPDPSLMNLALSTGLLRDVIDINDMAAVRAQVPRFLTAYRPGESWQQVADTHHLCWTFYWQAIFSKG